MLVANEENSLGLIPSPQQSLTFECMKAAYLEKGITLADNFASVFNFYTPDLKFNYAAYLLSDHNNFCISLAKYEGTDRSILHESTDFGHCSLIKGTKQLLQKLDKENLSFTRIVGKAKIDKRQIDPVSLKEATVNAIVHNDYSNGIPLKFEIFQNRIELTSSGCLSRQLSKEEFLTGYSAPKNKILMTVFRDLNLVDFLGSGIPRILSRYDQSVFKFSDHFLRIVFHKKS